VSHTRILVEQRPQIAIITLHEPEKRNPFSPVLIDELIESLTAFASNDEIVAVIFTGSGTAFSSGADLRVIRKVTPMEDRQEYDRILAMNRLIWNYPKVTIAAVNGAALGLGANLVGWCDLAIAEERATFGYPEVKAGIPSASVVPTLLRVLGRKAANELLLTGRRITAADAWRLGFVNRVVANGESLSAALELATEVARNTAHGLAFTKDVVRTTTDMEYNKALDYARDVRVISRLHPAFQGRIDNYLSSPEQRK
jgi:methylglutaconyl-CoA hydratase